jgi:hypothetical protein
LRIFLIRISRILSVDISNYNTVDTLEGTKSVGVAACAFADEMILFTYGTVQYGFVQDAVPCSMTSFHTVEYRYMYCAANPTIQYNEHDRLALVRANSSFEREAWKFT